MKQKKVKVVVGIVIVLCIAAVIAYFTMAERAASKKPVVKGKLDEIGFAPDLEETYPMMTLYTEFPTGTVNENSITVEYEVTPSHPAAFITEISYAINGEFDGYLYLRGEKENDLRSTLGEGKVLLSLGENHVVFRIEDSLGKVGELEVKQRPVYESVNSFPSYTPETITPSEQYEGWYYVNNILIVGTPDDMEVTIEEVEEAVKLVDGIRVGGYGMLHYIEVPNSTEDELDIMCELLMEEYGEIFERVIKNSFGGIEYNSVDKEVTAYPTNDTWWGRDEWGLSAIQAPEAWKYSESTQPVKVGILDDGFFYQHPELNLADTNINQLDMNNHGTHVMGIVGAVHGDGEVSGVVPLSRNDLFGYGLLGRSQPMATTDDVLNGLKWLVKDNKVKVVNASLGFDYTNTPKEAIDNTRFLYEKMLWNLIKEGNDFLIVAAAGNWKKDPDKEDTYIPYNTDKSGFFKFVTDPELVERIIVVGSIDEAYQVAESSNYGERIDIVAPGENIYSCWMLDLSGVMPVEKLHDSFSGTSMAAPHATGVATMAWAVNPGFSAADIKQIVLNSARESGVQVIDNRTSIPLEEQGRILYCVNALAAVEKASTVGFFDAKLNSHNSVALTFGSGLDRNQNITLWGSCDNDEEYTLCTRIPVEAHQNVTYIEKDLHPGIYNYNVVTDDETVYSKEKTIIILAAPTSFKVTNTKTFWWFQRGHKLTWSPVPNATGYEIYRSTDPNSGFELIATIQDGSKTTYTDTTDKEEYYYTIRAITENTYSDFAEIQSIKGKWISGEDAFRISIARASDSLRQAAKVPPPKVDPLIIDLQGKGITTISHHYGVGFDHTGDGFQVQSGWVGPEAGILVRDVSGNGNIDSGLELFGNHTLLKDGTLAANGFEALKDLDSNEDDVFDSEDPEYVNVNIWMDQNSNGSADTGELFTLSEKGIAAIYLDYEEIEVTDEHGNVFRQRGTCLNDEGTILEVVDIWFAHDPSSTMATDVIEVDDEIAALPDLAGFGTVYSLHQAMVRDESGMLKNLLIQFAAEESEDARRNLVPDIIYAWTGTSNNNIKALEALTGEQYKGGMHSAAMAVINQGFRTVCDIMYEHLMSQTWLAPWYDNLDCDSNGTYDLSETAAGLLRLLSQEQTQGEKELTDLSRNMRILLLSDQFHLADFYEKLGNENIRYQMIAEIAEKNILFGTKGSEKIGGTSADNAFILSTGNNTFEGGSGNDTYIIGEHFGNVTISYRNGKHSIILLIGVGKDDITLTNNRRNNQADYVVTMEGYSGSIILRNYQYEDTLYFVFADGTVIDSVEYMQFSEIHTAEDFANIRNDLYGNYRLMADLDLEGIEHTPIGTNTASYCGIFDGNGYSIQNVAMNLPSQSYVGLFGYHKGKIQNLTIKNSQVIGNEYVGGLTGFNSGHIENCSIEKGRIEGVKYTGGLVGCGGDGLLRYCYASTDVVGKSDAGGLMGRASNITIDKCYAVGSVKGSSVTASGLVGTIYGNTTLTNSFSYSNLGTSIISGGLIGNIYSQTAKIENCYLISNNARQISDSRYDNIASNSYFACEQSSVLTTDTAARTIAQMKNRETYEGWDFDTIWEMKEDGYPTLRGMKEPVITYQEIRTAEDLGAIHENLGGSYLLMNDINLEGVEWTPIGGINNPFYGSFEGNGHTIDNLTVELAQNYVGMFGNSKGKISNLTLSNIRVGGKSYTGGIAGQNTGYVENITIEHGLINGGEYTGGIAGYHNGSVRESKVSASKVNGTNDVGGLVGRGYGGEILYSYASGDVSGKSNIGGLLGIIENTAINQCYATGIVIGSNSYIGGLVGYVDRNAEIEDSFSVSTLGHTGTNVAGFAGYTSSYAGKIENCYSRSNHKSGFSYNHIKVVNCYFNLNLLNAETRDVNARTTEQMKNRDNYEGWDFETIWEMKQDDYPTLRKTGEPIIPYQEIWTLEELSCIGENLGGSYLLMEDINLEGVKWIPIGNSTTPFYGSFEGNGHTISNLTVEHTQDYAGMFGYNVGKISNLTLSNTRVEGNSYTGALAGYHGGSIENSAIETGYISGSQYIGGLVGYNAGMIQASKANLIQVKGNTNTGGLVGYGADGGILYSYATGDVSGGSNTGGLVGYLNSSKVEQCYATGSVKGSGNYTGGLAGYMHSYGDTVIMNSFSISNISANTNSAGFTGYFQPSGTKTKIENCYSISSNEKGFSNGSYKVFNSYFDRELLHVETADIKARSTAQMKAKETYEGWDFETIWEMKEDNYPTLRRMDMPTIPCQEIRSTQELSNINNHLGGNYRLMQDIDLEGVEWTPIGNNVTPFYGNFDGNGYTIHNLTVDTTQDYAGMFGYHAGSISNLGLSNLTVKGNDYTGGLAGYSIGSIKGIKTYDIKVNGNNYVGGLVGYAVKGSIRYSYASGDVNGQNRVGGLVGTTANITIDQCYTTGSVRGSVQDAGGLVGTTSDKTILSNSFSMSNVSANENAAGLIGTISIVPKLRNCYSISNHVKGFYNGYETVNSITVNCYFDRDLLSVPTTDPRARSTEEMKQVETYEGWDFDTIWEMKEDGYPTLRMLDEPMIVYQEIKTVEDLMNINHHLGGNYLLMEDINLEGVGWTPIGSNGNPFYGRFNGNGHTINNLTIETPQDYAGMFGYHTGRIRDLTLSNPQVNGNSYTGALTGYNSGNIENSVIENGYVNGKEKTGGLIGYSSGKIQASSVNGTKVKGNSYTGGLIGRVGEGVIRSSYASCEVSGGDDCIGGLIGYTANVTIDQCYATGSVSGKSRFTGGLVGYILRVTVVTNSFSTSHVSNGDYFAGLIGYISSGTTGTKIENCYSASSNINGLSTGSDIAVNSYFNRDLLSVTTTDSKARTTAEMKRMETYEGWDFDTIWEMEEGGYPTLRGLSMPAITYQEIRTVEELMSINNRLGGNYILMEDIDLEGVRWTPIGISIKPFYGSFDGNGHTISNLVIDCPQQQHVGMFGYSVGNISNLILSDIRVRGGAYTAALVGFNNGYVENVGIEDGYIKGSSYCGGLIGYGGGGAIHNSYVRGDIEGASYSGGLLGYAVNLTIDKCYTTGSIIGYSSYHGGFVGYIQEEVAVTNSFSTSYVSSSNTSAGFIGYMNRNSQSVTVENCYALPRHDKGFSNGYGTVRSSYFNLDLLNMTTTDEKARTTEEMKRMETYEGWDFDTIWEMKEDSYPTLRGRELPAITQQEIWTAEELMNIRNHLGGTYLLMEDLDLEGIDWTPIGSEEAPFYGSFDGNGHTISNLTVDVTRQYTPYYAGMFGYNAGSISNLTLRNIRASSYSYTGALAGHNTGDVEHVTIENGHISGAGYMGGLIGYNSGQISFSEAKDVIVTGGHNVGGLVGYNWLGSIRCSYASGDVDGNDITGGLVGLISSGTTIDQCYAVVNVVGHNTYNEYTGGLIGVIGGEATVTNSFYMGNITANGKSAGMIGGLYTAIATIENCYAMFRGADRFLSGNDIVASCYFNSDLLSVTTTDTKGRSTAQMKVKETYEGWDFDTIWELTEDGYPMLRNVDRVNRDVILGLFPELEIETEKNEEEELEEELTEIEEEALDETISEEDASEETTENTDTEETDSQEPNPDESEENTNTNNPDTSGEQQENQGGEEQNNGGSEDSGGQPNNQPSNQPEETTENKYLDVAATVIRKFNRYVILADLRYAGV